jgi:uncharacterized membrane protein
MLDDATLRIISWISSGIGSLDAIYLSWVKIAHSQVYCGTSGQCETVNNSPYSVIGGVPIAYLGLGAYLVVLLLLYLENRGGFWRENAPLMVFGISLVGVIFSVYLTYLEIWVIRAICPYCVLSAICMLILFVTSIFRLRQDQTVMKPVRSRGG